MAGSGLFLFPPQTSPRGSALPGPSFSLHHPAGEVRLIPAGKEARCVQEKLHMKVFHLLPDAGRWKLTEQGDGIVLYFDTKEDAVTGCAAYMGEHPGSLKIHHADGTIEEERTYPRALDPVESAG